VDVSAGTLPGVTEEAATIQVPPAQARELIDGGAQAVDVRTAVENAAGHISGAKHIPLDQLGADAAEELDSGRPVVVYCRGGNRSAAAAEALRNSGFDAHSIDGGLVSWDEAGLPLEPDGASIAPAQNLPPR
jgi:rhodanese-related sulfurtransferase